MSQIDVGPYKVSIVHDEFSESPREWDNLGKLVLFHRRYNLQNDTDYTTKDFSNWSELRVALEEFYKPQIILPVYMYDHSGLALRTSPFECPWDSGQVGYTFITKDMFKKEYNKASKKNIEHAKNVLINELDLYSHYINGDCWGFIVELDGEQVDSCFGYYNYDQCMADGCLSANSLREHEYV